MWVEKQIRRVWSMEVLLGLRGFKELCLPYWRRAKARFYHNIIIVVVYW